MRVRKVVTPLLVIASVAAVGLAAAAPASARAGAPNLKAFKGTHTKAHIASTATVTQLTDQVFGPFNVNIRGGNVLVADGFVGTVSRITSNGDLVTLARATYKGGDVAGVASGGGALAWTGGDGQNGHQTLTVRPRGGHNMVVDISAFENAHNPDAVNFYGTHSTDPCVTGTLEAAGFPVAYNGVPDAHAYSVAYAGNGAWYVADAAGNDILKVSKTGAISLVRVLPPQPVTFTAESAAAAGLPSCFAGVTYNFEPVPTDVEVWDGKLYMSLLPGGPEDPSLGARGSAYRMRANGSHLTKIGSGFLGATNIAVGGGSVYVSELFAGQVSKIVGGHGVPVAALPGPLGLEYSNGNLYAGVIAGEDAEGNPTPGAVVKISLS